MDSELSSGKFSFWIVVNGTHLCGNEDLTIGDTRWGKREMERSIDLRRSQLTGGVALPARYLCVFLTKKIENNGL